MAKSKVNIQPLSDRVVIKAAEAEVKSKLGIIIPENAKEKPPMNGMPLSILPVRFLFRAQFGYPS